jgi:hypothetical protein
MVKILKSKIPGAKKLFSVSATINIFSKIKRLVIADNQFEAKGIFEEEYQGNTLQNIKVNEIYSRH